MPLSDEELNRLKEEEKRKEEEKVKAEQKKIEDEKQRQISFENEVLKALQPKDGKNWFTTDEIAMQVVPNKLGYYKDQGDELNLQLMSTLISLGGKGKIKNQIVGQVPYYSAV